jgi:biopolymer transport protein ExbD
VEFDEPARRPHLYVDSRPVSWEDFAAVLQNDLNRRPPNWPVYFQGDPEMEWQWAVTVIDTIGGLHAEVILLTPASAPAKAPVSRAR